MTNYMVDLAVWANWCLAACFAYAYAFAYLTFANGWETLGASKAEGSNTHGGTPCGGSPWVLLHLGLGLMTCKERMKFMWASLS